MIYLLLYFKLSIVYFCAVLWSLFQKVETTEVRNYICLINTNKCCVAIVELADVVSHIATAVVQFGAAEQHLG